VKKTPKIKAIAIRITLAISIEINKEAAIK
jgi:hypothetical protein